MRYYVIVSYAQPIQMQRGTFADLVLRPVANVEPFQHDMEVDIDDETESDLYESGSDEDAVESHQSPKNNNFGIHLVRINIYLFFISYVVVSGRM